MRRGCIIRERRFILCRYEGSDLNETPAPMQSGWYQAASALRDQNTPQKKSIPSKFDRFDRSQSSKALPGDGHSNAFSAAFRTESK